MNLENMNILFQKNPNPMWIYDPADLSIKDVNTSAVDLYGYSKKEMLSMTITDLRPESEIPTLKKELSKRTNKFNNAGIWTHLKKNGDLIIVRVLSHTISEGNKIYKLVSIQDVTDEVQYQQELQMFMENSLDGIMITSPDGRIHKANKAICEMLGMEEEEILKLGRKGLVYNDQKFQQALKIREETGKFSGELTLIHKSGKKIPVELTTSVYTNPQGELRTSMVVRNVTDRKQLTQELKKSLERYHYATKATHDAIWDRNLIEDTIFWGEGFETLFGYDLDNLSEKSSWIDHIHPDDKDWIYSSIKNVIDGKKRYWFEEYRFLHADGRYKIVEDRGYVTRNEKGEAVRMIGAMRDVTEHHALQEKLDEAYKMARIGVWELDLQNNSLYWSPITRELHEVQPNFEPDLETGIHFYKEGESRNLIRNVLSKAIKEGELWDEELQIVTVNGKEKWVRTKGKPEFVEGKCQRIYGIIQDIHERKEAQLKMVEALKEQERILERITEAFFAVNENWIVTYWNSMAEKIIGVPRSEVLGENLWSKFPEAKELKFFKQYKRAFEEQVTISFEEYYPPIDVWLEVNGYPSEDGLSVFFKDITDRKLGEIELEKAYAEKDTILESIGDGFFAVNSDWVVTYWNSAAEQLLNTPKEFILDKNLWSVFEDALDLPSYTHYHKVMNEGVTAHFEDYYESLGRWYDINAYPASEGISVYFKDITQQKLREKELQESLKEKETLLAEVHHRVKNNLAIVSSLMQIQALEADNEAVSEKLNVSIGRIKTIASIHELLYNSNSFSRLEAENSVRKLITEISKTFEPKLYLVTEFDLQKIELNINQAIPLSLIINEVVTNILKHAFKDTDRGKLEAYMREKNQKVLLRITDNGKGLPKNFPKSVNKSSIGMKLIETLSTQLNAEYQFQTVDGLTHFSLNFQKSDLKGSSSGYIDE